MNGQTADIVVIGGGVMGVSIAHHLAQTGSGSVCLLEKRFIGAGSSGRSGAIIRQHYSTSLLVRMARHGVLTFRDFESAAAAESGWDNSGCLFVASSADRRAVEGNVGLMQQAGASAELKSRDAIEDLVPAAKLSPDEIGAWEPEAGYVDPALVLHGYARSARAAGADIREGIEVVDVEIRRGKVAGVQTSSGSIASGTVVLCAGPWARRLAERAGLHLPLTVIRPQVTFHKRPADFPGGSHPVVADLVNGYYCRPDPGGRTLVGALDVSDDEVIRDPDRFAETVSPEFFHWCHERLARRFPAMERSFGRGGYSGLYTMTPDAHPILGPAPAVTGLYLAVGFSGHGFKLSPAVGRGIAELIATGAYRSLDLTPLRAERFAEGEPIRSAYEYGLLS